MVEEAGIFGSYEPVDYKRADVFVLNHGAVLDIVFAQYHAIGGINFGC